MRTVTRWMAPKGTRQCVGIRCIASFTAFGPKLTASASTVTRPPTHRPVRRAAFCSPSWAARRRYCHHGTSGSATVA